MNSSPLHIAARKSSILQRYRRSLYLGVLVGVVSPAAPAQTPTVTQLQASGMSWPNKPVRFIVPFPAATATDVIARTIGQKLGDKWGQSVVIDNRPGAGGNLGTDIAAKSANDGYTLLWGTVANAISPSLYSKLTYNFIKDFTPIMLVAKLPLVLVANKAVPANNLAQLTVYAKSSSNKLSFGSGGVGTSNHLAGEMFSSSTGAGLVHVPYKGTPSAYADLMAGRVDMMFDNIVPAMAQIKSGQLKPIAVSSAKRSAALPEVPTLSESGIPGFEAVSWVGLLAPAGTPKSILDKIHQDLLTVLALPEIKERMATSGAELSPGSQADFEAFIRNETAKWAKAVKDSGAHAE